MKVEVFDDVWDAIEKQSLTQIEAAKRFGVTQPRISDLVRGKISLDALIAMAAKGGITLHIDIKEAASV